MKQLFKTIIVLLLFTGIVLPAIAGDTRQILATNSWTAAFVEMAGGDAERLAPSDMNHPPEYELKPSDVKRVRDADLLVYAGYEVLMKTVFDSFKKSQDQLIQITTSYDPAILEKSVLAIADRLGTTEVAEVNIRDYKNLIDSSRDKLKSAGLFGAPVLVHFHQKPLAEALGFKILGVYGPQPLEARQIAEFGRMKPELIIDNIHNPLAAPLGEILGVKVIGLVNFPGFTDRNGVSAPDTLPGVVEVNINRLLK